MITVDTSLHSAEENANSIVKCIEEMQDRKSVFEKVFEPMELKDR